MQLGRRLRGFPAQFRIKSYILASAILAVKQGSFGHVAAEHFFQTQGLGAELHLVAGVLLGAAPLVFHGKRHPLMFLAVVFHHVGSTRQAQGQRPQRHARLDPHPAPRFPLPGIHPLMHDPPFSREAIFRPDLFNVDQRALSGAEYQMLQCGKGEKVGFGVHVTDFAYAVRRRDSPEEQVSDTGAVFPADGRTWPACRLGTGR